MVTLTSIKDTGGTSNGGVDTTSLSVASTATVTAVNDEPVATAGGTLAYTENGSAVAIDNTIVLSDADDTQLTGATVTISSGFTSGDVLGFTTQNGITGSYNSGTGVLALSGTTSIANYQTALRSVTYSSSSDNPTASSTVTWAVTDAAGTGSNGAQTSTGVTSTVNVTAINDAPTLTAIAANPTFTEGGAAATLFSSAAVSAVESADNIGQLVLTVSNVTDGAAEILSIDGSSVALTHDNSVTTASHSMTAGVSLSGNTATVTLSKAGGITAAQAQTLVNALAYSNSSDDPTAANRVVTLTSIKDTGGTSNGGVDSTSLSVASTVTVTPVNDEPTVSAPASITVTEDGATSLTGISVSDVDAGSSNVVATFTVGSGALTGDSAIATANSVNVGGTSGALTLTGSTANINAFIAAGGLKFTTASNDTTAVTLGVSVNDQGNTGASGSQSSATTNVTLNVTAVNDAPTITSGTTYIFADTDEETASGGVTVNAHLTGAASWTDPDGTDVAKGIAVTGTTGNGTWQYFTDGGTWTDFGTVSGTSALLLDGATQVRYQPDLANGETASFIYKAWDETSGAASTNNIRQTANAGTGGGNTAFSSDSANGSITVTSVNDAPTGVGSLTLAAINEDTSNPTGTVISALTGYSFQDVDTGATTPGFLVVGNSANAATEGAWQYSSESGANWKAIGAVADGATALALANTTQLRFVPAANFNGAPTALNIRVLDNTYNGAFSATARGNETRVTADSSANGGATAISGSVNTISTNVTAINDAPSFIKGADQTVNEDAGVQTVNNWATGLSAGPADESGQTLNFTVNNDNNALFSLQPTIDSNGNLSYTPAANANGSATVTVSIKDSGGTANGGVDTSSGQTFTITVNSTTINLSQISGNTDGKQSPLISMVNTVRADNIAGAGINIDTDKNKIISDSLSTDYRNSTIDSFSSDNTGFSTKQAIVVYMELGVEASGNKTPGDTINMPFSVFAGLDTFGGVTITAELSTGQRLPPWISVDPITGAVTVKEGAVVTNLIIVKVTISDSRGNEVVVLVKVQPKQQQPDDTEKNQPPVKEKGQDQQSRAGHADKQPVYVSKPGLTQQLQMVGSKGFEMQRLKLLDSLASLVSNDKDAA
ncbi:MAG: Ig-like domain-containing protein [Methylobacter tundripaludum]|uniref:Cadherin domain-containing protein n=1 Tax=Methylobacter tundripaludum TaxID=173365 RepID=A0A2S6H3M2_9GAMM|nr:Ig-like domain-containing protein [Methylobacter tundripaludum]MCK9635095.1 Ig-like domain-containing protein [Methylobacter tundripaludum]PPK72020.1 hypothetical protein B0F88_105132 [Methylobacter tundripaludum]